MTLEPISTTKVCVLGLWHLGLVSAAALAERGHVVTGCDRSRDLIANLREGKLPIYEPGLEPLIRANMARSRLRFESDYESALSGAHVILMTYDTPVDERDRADLSVIEDTISAIIPFLESCAVLIVNSQIPVGSCERWQALINGERPNCDIDVVYSPENLRLGHAIELFQHPDMIVIGSHTDSARRKAERFYQSFPSEKFYVSWRTAEMAKHALNGFFATSISFANELGNLCDAVGADGIALANILKKDGRIGSKAQLRPGLGFAGGTLARDLRSLQSLGEQAGVSMDLVDSVLRINERQSRIIAHLVAQYFEGQLRNKIISLFGLTYKPGTSTLRRSAAFELIEQLQGKGAHIRAHDPKAERSEYQGALVFDFYRDPYEAARDSHGILILTEWPEFRSLDYLRIKQSMSHAMILDAKNFLDLDRLRELGYRCLEIGRGQAREVKVR